MPKSTIKQNELTSIQTTERETDKRVYSAIRETLHQAHHKVEVSINSAMVEAYWEIGRQIAEATGERAEYGKHLISYLSTELTAEFGRGFSVANLKNMRQFYLVFQNRYALRSELGWTHYRTLMRLPNEEQRIFYMNAAADDHWTSRQLDHQIATFYQERLLATQEDKRDKIRSEIQKSEPRTAADAFIKDPYVLDFLDFGDRTDFDEKTLEQALISRLQEFMLELGRGFAFVGRQYRLDAENASYYVDLVFYHIKLKCYVLIELKTRPLTPQDVGQLDFYVRLFDEKYTETDDGPTIGLILCSSSDRTVAKYSALADGKGLFASSYVTYLPTEEELTDALEPTRRAAMEAKQTKEDDPLD